MKFFVGLHLILGLMYTYNKKTSFSSAFFFDLCKNADNIIEQS